MIDFSVTAKIKISSPPCVASSPFQALAQWQSALDKCKAVWKELRGVPLLPLANGTAGSFPSSFLLGGRKRFILGTRKQQGLLPQLKHRFVHLKATRRLARFFEHDSFLEVGVACGWLGGGGLMTQLTRTRHSSRRDLCRIPAGRGVYIHTYIHPAEYL